MVDPRTELVETVIAEGTAVVATIHDRARRAFDIHCSICGCFETRLYHPGTTKAASTRIQAAAVDAAREHADTCGATA